MTLPEFCAAVRARLEHCHDTDPEKWNPDTRSYYYPKWDEFALHAPTDLDRLLRIVEVYEAALKLYQQGWSTVGTHELDAGGRRVFKWRNPSLDFIGPAFADEALAQADAIAAEMGG